MDRVPWRSSRPCRATVDWPDPYPMNTSEYGPPDAPNDLIDAVIEWGMTRRSSNKDPVLFIEQFKQSDLVCMVDKEQSRILSRASSMADVIILNGGRGLSASATVSSVLFFNVISRIRGSSGRKDGRAEFKRKLEDAR